MLWSRSCSREQSPAHRNTHHDSAVLGAAGDDLVIVGTPIDVQHRPRVATHCGVGLVNPACLEGRRRKRAVKSQRKVLPNPLFALSYPQFHEVWAHGSERKQSSSSCPASMSWELPREQGKGSEIQHFSDPTPQHLLPHQPFTQLFGKSKALVSSVLPNRGS